MQQKATLTEEIHEEGLENTIIKEEAKPKKRVYSETSVALKSQTEACKPFKKFKTRKFTYELLEYETFGSRPIKLYTWVSNTQPNKFVKDKPKNKDTHRCEVCNKVFTEKRNLQRHLNIHAKKETV
ncbi:hypothetical protein H312_01574 [Anncaliia algerae PRA339]|uniref:C2H2-type domain-containing protein n=1 Tax=Anncaliia algerae PRA339 TaxID=1288291 RepID=A0A059F1Q4_9MICR|nr:hypothetical protein H312_01574 [Anncaliia algerae PRA339]